MSDPKLEYLQNLLALFDRPMESLLIPKANRQFLIPAKLAVDKYKYSIEIIDAEAKTRSPDPNQPILVQVEDIEPPELGDIVSMGTYDYFSLFLPKHIELAAKLMNIFLESNNFVATAVYAYERVNRYLFYYAYSVAILHRSDTKGLNIPNLIQLSPDKFYNKHVFTAAAEQMLLLSDKDRRNIELGSEYMTASDMDVEHRVAYFREDLALNLHHWHWHLAYPTAGPDQVLKKNRRGELFYYMHQQIIARYNFERFCCDLRRAETLSNWTAPIEEAYFPKLDSLVASRAYPARPKDMHLSDIDVPSSSNFTIEIADMIRWRDRIFMAIDMGVAIGEDRKTIELNEESGIDILGNMIEASDLSINRQFYGNLHNAGHLLISFIHDPRNYYLERMGVMGDAATAMRDPIFYRWHTFVDSIFRRFKATLPVYTDNQLNFDKVTITGLSVKTEGQAENVFRTYWMKSSTKLYGLDFIQNEKDKVKKPICVNYTHSQHEHFSYNITVRNDDSVARDGTVRIFMSPAFDEAGKEWLFRHQSSMFIEMDRFKVTMQPGEHTITRKSTESSVSIPFEQTFHDPTKILEGLPASEQQVYGFCGCGWPQHLLVPKGTENGFASKLFVMISNYEDDKVEQDAKFSCTSGDSYCGVRGGNYPDRRAMGFPFDRLPQDKVETLEAFMKSHTNMHAVDCQIVNNKKLPE